MGAISLLSTASSNSYYGTTSISLAPFQPALTAVTTALPTAAAASKLITTATAFVAVASATAVTATGEDSGSGAENGECQLLGPFAIFIQAALGVLALSSLVYKRWRERPQRPLKIWGFDVSKQVVGSILLHLANLLMSMLSSGQLTVSPSTMGAYKANPCSFYLLNLAIDTTLGIPILIFLLRLLTYGFLKTPLASPPESIRSGNYGQPPKAAWWLKQCLIYFLGLLGMKACVFFIFKICPWIVHVGDWALRWTEGNEMVQVFFVMLFFPVIMNALQYYIIDGFIKNQNSSDHEPIPSEDGEADESQGQMQQDGDRDASIDSEDEPEDVKAKKASAGVRKPSSSRVAKLKLDQKKLDEYNPDHDGEDSPTVVGSGSNSLGKNEDESLLQKGNKAESQKKPK
ncbi:hypothetical protein MMC13_001974 [Lambiella insularis]|nr:hypothetical protein [Lambiella insularis]